MKALYNLRRNLGYPSKTSFLKKKFKKIKKIKERDYGYAYESIRIKRDED